MSSPRPHQFVEVAEVYDSLMSVVPYARWVSYLEELWSRYGLAPHRVLDVACGTGAVTRELLARGYSVAGVDLSAGMLRVAQGKLPKHCHLWRQDISHLEVEEGPYDAAVCLFDSLNYLLKLDQLRGCFSGLYRGLRPGGLFIFDLNTRRALEKGMFTQRGTGYDSSLEFVWLSHWNAETELCHIDMEFLSHETTGTRRFQEIHVQRAFTQQEVETTLTEAGLEPLAFLEAFRTTPPTSKSDRIHVVARRPG